MREKTLRAALAALACSCACITAAAASLAEAAADFHRGDHVAALRKYADLANTGDAEAQRIVGEMVFRGQGGVADPKAAFVWTSLAAQQGDRIAQYNLGYLHEHGHGTPASMPQVLHWYERAARQG